MKYQYIPLVFITGLPYILVGGNTHCPMFVISALCSFQVQLNFALQYHCWLTRIHTHMNQSIYHGTIKTQSSKGTQSWEIVSWCGVTPFKAEVYWTEVVQQTFEVHDMSYSGGGGDSKGNLHHWNFQISEYLWLDRTGVAQPIIMWQLQWCWDTIFQTKKTYLSHIQNPRLLTFRLIVVV